MKAITHHLKSILIFTIIPSFICIANLYADAATTNTAPSVSMNLLAGDTLTFVVGGEDPDGDKLYLKRIAGYIPGISRV